MKQAIIIVLILVAIVWWQGEQDKMSGYMDTYQRSRQVIDLCANASYVHSPADYDDCVARHTP